MKFHIVRGMALFFDQEWFDARLGERGLDRPALAGLLGLHPSEIEDMWKDQREISAREVILLAGLLGVSVHEIARYGGITTPVPGNQGSREEAAGALARIDALEARLSSLEEEMAALRLSLLQLAGEGKNP